MYVYIYLNGSGLNGSLCDLYLTLNENALFLCLQTHTQCNEAIEKIIVTPQPPFTSE